MTELPDNVRIDQWLWAARFFKTRSLAKQAVEAGRAEKAAMRDGYRAPEQRPDKRARRLIRALGDIDLL
jgi:ribosome-associated heat shock protein Hsp15